MGRGTESGHPRLPRLHALRRLADEALLCLRQRLRQRCEVYRCYAVDILLSHQAPRALRPLDLFGQYDTFPARSTRFDGLLHGLLPWRSQRIHGLQRLRHAGWYQGVLRQDGVR